MWKLADWCANWFVPLAYRNDPTKSGSEHLFRGTARIQIFVMAIMVVSGVFIATTTDYLYEIAVLCGIIPFNLAGLTAMRLTRNLIWPLLFSNITSMGIFTYVVVITGGISSAAVWTLMSLSTLAISFGDRRVFAVVWWAIASMLTACFLAELFGVLPAYVPRENELMFHFIVLIGCYVLVGVGGFSAQRSIDTNKRRVKASQKALAEQNEVLEGLASKLSKYLSPQVYQSIFEGRQEAQIGAKRKKLSVYFADIVGFTQATERMEPEDLAAFINDYFENIAEIVLRHGGTIDKYMGDAVMVFFGDPESLGPKEDAIACMNMALEIRERIRSLEERWAEAGLSATARMRSGVNTGYCTVGNFGSENRMDYTIIGAQVNVAARLEREAEPNQILVSHQTAALVRSAFDLELAGEYRVKGVQAPIQAYRLMGPIQSE